MSNNNGLLAQPGMQVLLALLACIFLGWPLINIAGERGTWSLFIYVFSVWSVLVLVLVFVGRVIARFAHFEDSSPDLAPNGTSGAHPDQPSS